MPPATSTTSATATTSSPTTSSRRDGLTRLDVPALQQHRAEQPGPHRPGRDDRHARPARSSRGEEGVLPHPQRGQGLREPDGTRRPASASAGGSTKTSASPTPTAPAVDRSTAPSADRRGRRRARPRPTWSPSGRSTSGSAELHAAGDGGQDARGERADDGQHGVSSGVPTATTTRLGDSSRVRRGTAVSETSAVRSRTREVTASTPSTTSTSWPKPKPVSAVGDGDVGPRRGVGARRGQPAGAADDQQVDGRAPPGGRGPTAACVHSLRSSARNGTSRLTAPPPGTRPRPR